MANSPARFREDLAPALQGLAELSEFTGAPREFWPRYLACLGGLTAGSKVVLLLRPAGTSGPWQPAAEWSAHGSASRLLTIFSAQLDTVATRCLDEGQTMAALDPTAPRATGHYVVATRLKLHRSEQPCVVAALLSEVSEAAACETLLRLQLAAGVPQAYQLNQAVRQAGTDVEKFAGVLDLMVLVNAEKRFLAAALAFCNGLAGRFRCDRVSLGWLEAGYIRLRTISRTENFDRQMAAAQALEVAMEECLDQDEEVVWPPLDAATVVTRDHERFVQDQKSGQICSLPLRIDQKVVGVLTAERQTGPFTANEVQQLRLCCDQAVRRLSELKQHDRWFGARWACALREQSAKLVGPEHTWAKLLALLVTTCLAVLFVVKVNYRVEGNFVLRSDELAYLTAPFDGFIHDVFVRKGDAAQLGTRLLGLDTRELELEDSAALADVHRYEREAEKARAARNLAEMRIAQALTEQAQARLSLVRHRLAQATVRSPFVGVVVEGDLRERLGAPVKQGDALFKVARLDTLYVEAEINERDIHELLGPSRGTAGEIAFVSQPKLKYPIRVVRIEPAALPKPDGNVFLVRCEVESGSQPWWRPGMSGLCKLQVEKRTLLWILTHRTVDFLRMKLWW